MLLSALILGLVSSLHCIAMCGPIAMVLPVARNNAERKALQIILYHLGRLTSYATLGLLFGIFGRGLYLAGLQQQLSIAAGIIMILIVAVPEKTFARYNFSRPVYTFISKAKSAMGARLKNPSLTSLYTIGLLNGLLPCAMIYAALFGALATQDVFSGALYMGLFGLGTVPLMSGVSYLTKSVTIPVRNKMQKIIPFAMVCIGALFILRGLSLGNCYSPGTLEFFIQPTPACR
jgi:sulfite exporter TauE/SafE